MGHAKIFASGSMSRGPQWLPHAAYLCAKNISFVIFLFTVFIYYLSQFVALTCNYVYFMILYFEIIINPNFYVVDRCICMLLFYAQIYIFIFIFI